MRVIKSGIEIKSKKNIAEKIQTSVYKVTEKFQNRYENKRMFNFEPRSMRGISVAEVFHCKLIFASKSSSTLL